VKKHGFLVIIVLLSVLVLAVTIGTIMVGSRQFDGVVTERPYETGLAWDEVRKEQQRLGWQITFQESTLRKGSNDLSLTILQRNGKPLESATVLLSISRPASRDYDRTYEVRQLGDGRFAASIELPSFGYWDLRFDIRQGKEHVELRERIYAQE
jgi:nitrogen fixation protein FixH